MCRINKYKCMIIISIGILILLFSRIVVYKSDSQNWDIENVYGKWKVTRLIGAYKGTKGDIPYGDNIGRSFIITDESIIDSMTLQDAVEEAEEQRCFSMEVLCQKENVFDLSKQDAVKQFQINYGIILETVGITDKVISQYVFYSKNDRLNDQNINYHIASEFEVFSYKQDDKDKLIVDLPMGFYLLERFKKQENVDLPCGLWMVESLISRGRGEKYGLAFYDYYGNCFDIAENYIIDDEKKKKEVIWKKELVFKDIFEEEYGIYAGLGLENDELEIWNGTGENDNTIKLIPINDNEMIMSLDEQWFLLGKVFQYEEPVEKYEDVLDGIWKITQLIGVKDVEPDMEICGRDDYKAWWYTQVVIFDVDRYAPNAVPDWENREYEASNFFQEFNVPDNITHLFEDDDILHVGMRKIYDVDEVYILINSNMLIRGRNGLWYILERQV